MGTAVVIAMGAVVISLGVVFINGRAKSSKRKERDSGDASVAGATDSGSVDCNMSDGSGCDGGGGGGGD